MGRFTRTKRWGLIFGALLLSVLSIFSYGGLQALAVDEFQVSGTVTNQNNSGIQNVTITATTPGTADVVAGPVSSSLTGAYQLTVSPGTYDFHFQPPGNTGLNELVQNNVTVSANRTLDIQLAPASEQHTFSGVLTDYNGNPLPGIQIRLNRNMMAVADNTGRFSGSFPADIYDVSIRKDSLDAPEYPYFWLPQGTVDLSVADVVQNYQLPPVFKLGVTTRNYDGSPVANQLVHLEVDPMNLLESTTGFSNTQGVAELPIIKDIVIPAGAVCTTFNPGNAKVCNQTPIDATQNTDITLTAPNLNLRTVSGTVSDANGTPIAGLDVKFNGQTSGGVKTNSSGVYSFTAVGDIYDVIVTKDDSSIAKAFPYFTIASGQADISTADLTKNIQLPAVRSLQISLADPNGTPISSQAVSYSVGNRFQPGNESWQGSTDGNGQVTLPVLDGVTLPVGSVCAYVYGDSVCNTAALPITGDTSLALQGPASYVFSGRLMSASGTPLRNIRVELNGYGTITTKTGAFSLRMKAGTYDLVFRNLDQQAGLPFFTLPQGTINLTNADITTDYHLPQIYQLSVTVKDIDGNPLQQGVSITNPANFNSGTTNQSGLVNLPVFNGTTINTGQLCTTFPDGNSICNTSPLVVSGDASVLFQQSPAAIKPAIPANVSIALIENNPVISWSAVQTADYYIVYRDGNILTSTSALEHTDLTTDPGEHTYYVVAVNSAGISSDPSDSVTITIQSQDTTPPVVSSFTLPTKNINQTLPFNVPASDVGSGVVAGEYFYGPDPGVGNGTAMTYSGDHLSGTLGVNLPAGVYSISVRARDDAGNWSSVKTAQLVVTGAPVTRAIGQQVSFRPTQGTDVLPNMASATILSSARSNFNIRYTSSGITDSSTFALTYDTGGLLCTFIPSSSGCHTFSVSMTEATSFQLQGTNYSKAKITGNATITIDGVTSSRPFALEVTDGNRVNGNTQDTFAIRIYAPGADVTTAEPQYHVSKSVSRSSITLQ